MYDVEYKIKLKPIQHENGKIRLMTEIINEQLIINFTPNHKINQIEYIDCSGKIYNIRKI